MLTAVAGAAVLADESPGQEQPDSYRVTAWTIADGLPQGTINSILQGPDGQLWIATFGGLLRFDGIEFRTFDLDTLQKLPSNRITGIASDGADGLWITSQAGHLTHFCDGAVIEDFIPPDSIGETIAVARDDQGAIWTLGSEGVVRRFAQGSWTTPIPAGGHSGFRGLCADHAGGVCVSSGRDCVRFDASAARMETVRAPAQILSVADLETQGTWLGLADGLARIRAGGVERVATDPPLSGPVHAIAGDGFGGLWLGTAQGVEHVVPEAREPGARWLVRRAPTVPNGFDVRSLMRDREGNVWVGSSGRGLVRLSPQHIVRFGPDEIVGATTALAEDGEGGAWIASNRSGLAHLARDARRAADEPFPTTDVTPISVYSLLLDRRGALWIGQNKEILRRVGREYVPIPAHGEFAGRTGPMIDGAGDSAGDVWLGTSQGHLVRLSSEGAVREELDVPGQIICLAATPDGTVWIGGEDALFRYREHQTTRFGAEDGLPRGAVRDVFPDADGSLWIATYGGGLGRLSGNRLTRIARAQGLPDNALSRIQDDGRGRLWLLSNRGLIVAQRSDLLAVASGDKPRIDPLVFGPEAGVPEANFGMPAGFRDRFGRLWFGTIAGVVRVDPREFPFNRTPPKVRIEKLLAEDRDLTISGGVEIPPDTRHLVFEFTAFALSAPERVHFRYRLDPYDAEWVEAGSQRRASYGVLSPGPFTFRVAARNEDGVWSERPTELAVRVLPSWWQTTLFRLALAVAVLGTFLAFHLARTRMMERRARIRLEAAEARADAEELRAELAHVGRVAMAGELATSLAHEVNQPLAAIVTNAQAGRRFLARDGIDRGGMDEILSDIAQQGQRASDVIRRLREFLRKHPVERRRLDVNAVLRDTLPLVRRELEDHQVGVVLALADDLPSITADPVQIQQVLVNLVKNACEAMSENRGERRVELQTRASAGGIELEVRDTGPGLAPDLAARLFQPFVTTKADGMGMGLAISRSIVEAHDGRITAVSRTEGGAVFRVVLPARTTDEVET
jgi:signal transduction histidine kinase/ligand-binding sensor domain-containing protein